VLRLWVSSVDYTSDMRLGRTILGQQADIYRKIRNTARYLISNLYDFNPATDCVTELPSLEQYILHRLAEVIDEVTDAFEHYQFFRFYQTIQNFCVIDLSSFYLDIAKDALYISAPNALRRRQVQTVLYHLLETVTRLIAPVLCHLAEDIWQALPYAKSDKSVFLAGWPKAPAQWLQPELALTWKSLINARNLVTLKLEEARIERKIGSSLEAKLYLQAGGELYKILADYQAQLRYLFIVSQVSLEDSATENLVVEIAAAEGHKCPRCWNYSTQIGVDSSHPEVCERCAEALSDTASAVTEPHPG